MNIQKKSLSLFLFFLIIKIEKNKFIINAFPCKNYFNSTELFIEYYIYWKDFFSNETSVIH